MPEQPQRSFFWTLAQRAGSQQRENQLSSTFAACFQQSRWFQRVIIAVLSQACRLDKSFAGTEWVCSEERHPPKGGQERIDLCLTPATLGPPTFHIESKVESPLTEEQLRRFRKKGAEYLIALTKHPPEVSERRLRQLGAYGLRWQDIHRALLSTKPTGHIDRFIRSTFVTFLEELGMAHAADLTLGDLKQVQEALTNIRSPKTKGFVPKQAFQCADALLDFLAEVKGQFIDANPKMEHYRNRWGPGFTVYYDDQQRAGYSFGWKLSEDGSNKHFVRCSVILSGGSRAPVLVIGAKRKDESTMSQREWPLKQCCTKRVLDIDRCVQRLNEVAKKRQLV